MGLEMEMGDLVIWGAAMVVAGLVGGLLAGLLGVGGGIIIVPVLYHLLTALDIDADVRMKIAVATSLSTIIATSIVSVRSHARRGAVDPALLRSWGVPIFMGVLLGTFIGGYSEGWVLTLVFAVIALLVAVNLMVSTGQLREGFPNAPVKAGAGVFVGMISAMMGIGGGTLSVPILSAVGYDIRKAVGTAAAIGFLIAIPGTLGYMWAGYGNPSLPPMSLGYVNGLAAAVLIPLTMLMAPVGARLAHSVDRKWLKRSFAAFLVLTSARMFYDLLT